MRNTFFDEVYKLAKNDKDIIVLMSDTGATVFEEFRRNLPDQCVNVGIAEQNLIGIAAGLTMNGKKVYCYGIIPFVTSRCHDQIRVDLCCQNLPVTIVGVGVGYDYSTLGPTHHGIEDIALMRVLPNMEVYCPSDNYMTKGLVRYLDKVQKGPVYVRVDRTGEPEFNLIQKDYNKGYNILHRGKEIVILATGRMVWTALQVRDNLSNFLDVGVIDVYRLKPLNESLLSMIKAPFVATLEAHSIIGGLGSSMAEMYAESHLNPHFVRLGMADRHCRVYGDRDYLQRYFNLDVKKLTNVLLHWYQGYTQVEDY